MKPVWFPLADLLHMNIEGIESVTTAFIIEVGIGPLELTFASDYTWLVEVESQLELENVEVLTSTYNLSWAKRSFHFSNDAGAAFRERVQDHEILLGEIEGAMCNCLLSLCWYWMYC